MDGDEFARLREAEKVEIRKSWIEVPLLFYGYLSCLIVLGVLFLWLVFAWRP